MKPVDDKWVGIRSEAQNIFFNLFAVMTCLVDLRIKFFALVLLIVDSMRSLLAIPEVV